MNVTIARTRWLAAAVAALMLVPFVVEAQQSQGGPAEQKSAGETFQHPEEKPASGQVTEQDLDFADLAARNAHTIVKVGTYALDQAENAKVRNLIVAMVDTSDQTIERLNGISEAQGLDVPRDAGPKGEQLYNRFTGNWDDGLDLLYVTQMEIMLTKLIDAYQLEIEEGSDPQLKQLAQDMLPRLQTQQTMAAALQGEIEQRQSTISGDR